MSSAVVVIGAGPAGLTAAWELTRNGRPTIVIEADPRYVGGIARTVEYRGYRFDIGGHRFFTKSPEVRRLWSEMLSESEWQRDVPRLSRIYYGGRFFAYPLKALDALSRLGVLESARCGLSYFWARLTLRRRSARSFEDWVIQHFGARLYRTFFKTYTEKVWGIPCTDISADWAAQRIKGLSLSSAVRSALPSWMVGRGAHIKTLIDRFDYPRLGPGHLWETVARTVTERGGAIRMGRRVTCIRHASGRVVAVQVTEQDAGREQLEEIGDLDALISTMPVRELVDILEPLPPPRVLRAAGALRYRDFLTVVLVIDVAEVFPDNWIYVHDPSVLVGRIQNFKNWSPEMISDPATTSLGLEYFCTEGDALWSRSDDDLTRLAASELGRIGLLGGARVVDSTVVRMPKAYPVYDDEYKTNVRIIRQWIESHATNLQLVGRNGMHMYNNQDHSMLAAYLAAKNLLGERWDPWLVNADAEYHEEIHDGDEGGRLVPRRLTGS